MIGSLRPGKDERTMADKDKIERDDGLSRGDEKTLSRRQFLRYTTLAAGATAFTLTLTGTDFVPASVVRWNGSPRTTTFVHSTQLAATIPASDLTSPGTFNVTVSNPQFEGEGGGTSAPLPFTIGQTTTSLAATSAHLWHRHPAE